MTDHTNFTGFSSQDIEIRDLRSELSISKYEHSRLKLSYEALLKKVNTLCQEKQDQANEIIRLTGLCETKGLDNQDLLSQNQSLAKQHNELAVKLQVSEKALENVIVANYMNHTLVRENEIRKAKQELGGE